jgi:hypothetical protein
MPIFVMAVAALVVFLAIGLLLFSATIAEHRQRHSLKPPGKASEQSTPEKPASRAAHA